MSLDQIAAAVARARCAPPRKRQRPYADTIADVELMIGTDTPEGIARRLGYTDEKTLYRVLERARRHDLATRLRRTA